MGNVIFNGVSSLDYGIQVEHPPAYHIPAKDYEVVHIPGRNGDIVIDKGSYQNVTREYEIAIGNIEEDFTSMANRIAEWVSSADGYARLEDTYEPDYYRLAYYDEEATIENILQHAGRVTVNFKCKPQRYLKSGEQTITVTKSNSYILNPTLFPSKPIIKIFGSSASGTLTVGGIPITFDLSKDDSKLIDYLVIDCERQDAYYDTNKNGNSRITIPNGFPELKKGTTIIKWDKAITKVEVIPKWWTI